MPNLPGHRHCTACMACVDACSYGALFVEESPDGFARVRRRAEKCVACGKCEKVCPVKNSSVHGTNHIPSPVFPKVAWSRDAVLREQSSSGGIFAELARMMLKQGGVVAGARLDGTRVRHALVEMDCDLPMLQGTKYMWSDATGIYSKVRLHLRCGRPVLFSGTPCQTAAMTLSCTPQERQHLLTVDLVCHGVPSRCIWDWFAESHPRISRICSFRDKQDGWRNSFAMTCETEDGKRLRVAGLADSYTRLFLADLALRPACYRCPFAGLHRISDLTLADAWGVKEHREEERLGMSLVLCHTKKGKAALQRCSVVCHSAVWLPVLQANPRIYDGSCLYRYHPARLLLRHPGGLSVPSLRRIFQRRFRGQPKWGLQSLPLAMMTFFLSRLIRLRGRIRSARLNRLLQQNERKAISMNTKENDS